MSFLKNFLKSKPFHVSTLHDPNRSKNVIISKKLTVFQEIPLHGSKNPHLKHLKRLLLFVSGYVAYQLSKDRWLLQFPQWPTVTAASVFSGNSLSGRRDKFNFIADVVETSAPAVVYIEIKDSRRVDFFTGKPSTISNGSGFIIEENGLILTNAHVVTNKPHAKVEVRLIDGTIYNGVVEDIGLAGKDMVYIQTDAAITFGNSGGPLVNLDGEAIGVNSMKVTAGISFAIPIDYVKAFLLSAKGQQKNNGGGPKRLYMGITMLTLTPEIVHELQQRNHEIPRDIGGGVLVWKVIYGSPAHNGGLQPGDIVTHIDGKPIKHANDVYSILNSKESRTLKMSVSRYGKKIDLSVTPEDFS